MPYMILEYETVFRALELCDGEKVAGVVCNLGGRYPLSHGVGSTSSQPQALETVAIAPS